MRILRFIKFTYVQSAPLNDIKRLAIGKSLWERIKAELKVGSTIMSEGYKEAKKDISFYYNNRNNRLSPQQERRMYEIKNNLCKVPPIAILFWFPGGLPIVLAYMAFLPALTPTWFLLDTYKEHLDEERRKRQMIGLKYFLDCGSIVRSSDRNELSSNLNMEVFKRMSLQQKKKVMHLCYGQSFDGTNLIRETFKISFSNFISPALSSYLMDRNMEERMKGEQKHIENINQDWLTHKVLKQAARLLKGDQK